jgi:hypothetical protein
LHCDRIKILFIILLTVSTVGLLFGQQADTLGVVDSAGISKQQVAALDSLGINGPPTYTIDSITGDTIPIPEATDNAIEEEVIYNAADSLVFSMDLGTVELYKEAKITYGEIELTADYIRYEMDQNM